MLINQSINQSVPPQPIVVDVRRGSRRILGETPRRHPTTNKNIAVQLSAGLSDRLIVNLAYRHPTTNKNIKHPVQLVCPIVNFSKPLAKLLRGRDVWKCNEWHFNKAPHLVSEAISPVAPQCNQVRFQFSQGFLSEGEGVARS